MKNAILILILSFFISCVNGQDNKITVDEIWNNYLQTFGNKKIVMNVKTLSREILISSKQGEIRYKLKIKYPDKVYQEIIYPNNQKIISIFNGNKGIHIYPNGKVAFTKKEIFDTKLLGLIFPELYYKELGYKFKLIGIDTVKNNEYYKIEITNNDSDKFYFLINVKDFKVYYTDYSDLKTEIIETSNTDGISFVKKSKAIKGSETMISNTIINKFNIPINDKIFELK